jgi:hypothetical protein
VLPTALVLGLVVLIGLGIVKVRVELVPLEVRVLVARPEALVVLLVVPRVVAPERLVVLQRLADERRHAQPRRRPALAVHDGRPPARC